MSPTLGTPPGSAKEELADKAKREKKSAHSSILPMGVPKVVSDPGPKRHKSFPGDITEIKNPFDRVKTKDHLGLNTLDDETDSPRTPAPIIIVDDDPDA